MPAQAGTKFQDCIACRRPVFGARITNPQVVGVIDDDQADRSPAAPAMLKYDLLQLICITWSASPWIRSCGIPSGSMSRGLVAA